MENTVLFTGLVSAVELVQQLTNDPKFEGLTSATGGKNENGKPTSHDWLQLCSWYTK
jgi:hypothetical protein